MPGDSLTNLLSELREELCVLCVEKPETRFHTEFAEFFAEGGEKNVVISQNGRSIVK